MKKNLPVTLLGHVCLVTLFACIFALPLHSQIITTAYGNYSLGPGFSGDGKLATATQLNNPAGVATDKYGNVYIADRGNLRVRKVDNATHKVSTFAGNGKTEYPVDGKLATEAGIGYVNAVAVDTAGNIYISGSSNVWKVDVRTQIITTVAGNGSAGFSGDSGLAINASLNGVFGIFVDKSGDIYIADSYNYRIRKVDAATGIITTYAGSTGGSSGDGGPAIQAQLLAPRTITEDLKGNLYIADQSGYRIRKVDGATHIITTFAGTGSPGFSGDGGAATLAKIMPAAVLADSSGNLYITGFDNRVRKVNASNGLINTVTGDGTAGFSGDGGPAMGAEINDPSGIALAKNGNILFADGGNSRIREIDTTTLKISTFAGDRLAFGGDGGPASGAIFNLPYDIKFDGSGNLFISDAYNNRVREVNASTGIISTIAGNGKAGYSTDSTLADTANLHVPFGVIGDSAGNVFFCDNGNLMVREFKAADHRIYTVAGKQGYNFGTYYDSLPGTQTFLISPMGLAADTAGNLYIADPGLNRILKLNAVTKIITCVAGNGMYGSDGDGGPATQASLYFPSGVALDKTGNLYIADSWNYRIRKVNAATHIITTVAGNGINGYSGDGDSAAKASIGYAVAVNTDSAGNVYIPFLGTIRRVDAKTNIITTIAGQGTGYGGDGGLATKAYLNGPTAVAFDKTGAMFIADYENNVIRKVAPVALPVTLLSFNALKKENNGILNWETASEVNSAYFIVERGVNGFNFTALGKVAAKGNSAQPQYYSLTDNRPGAGVDYYRLRQVDLDGQVTYSPVLSLDFTADPIIKMYPDPVKDVLTVDGLPTTGNSTVTVTDASGKIVFVNNTSTSRFAVNVNQLAHGTYFVNIRANKKNITKKFVKQ